MESPQGQFYGTHCLIANAKAFRFPKILMSLGTIFDTFCILTSFKVTKFTPNVLSV